MSQVDAYTIPPSSPLYMADLQPRLEAIFAAVGSANRGATAPADPFEGMSWWDSSAAPVDVLKRYNTTTGWIELLSVNISTGAVSVSGLEIGADVQAFDAKLAALAGLSPVANRLAYFTGPDTVALTALTSFARTVLATSNATAMLAALGIVLGTSAGQIPTADQVSSLVQGVPAGMRGSFFMSAPPAGWLKANGAAVLVASYSALTTAIYCGDANNATALWGYRCTSQGSPSTSRSSTGAYIVLPDARGEFERGWDDGRGIDATRSLWSAQAGAIESHTHTVNTADGNGAFAAGARPIGNSPGANYAANSGNIGSTGGAETRPRNLAALICIKY